HGNCGNTANGTATEAPTEPSELRVVRKLLSSLKPSPENERLYDYDHEDIVAFSHQLAKEGLQESLVITADRYIVSGHRGFSARRLLGRVKAPCRVLPWERMDKSEEEYLAILRSYNRQRDKSVAEKARETMVDLDPDDADLRIWAARYDSVN